MIIWSALTNSPKKQTGTCEEILWFSNHCRAERDDFVGAANADAGVYSKHKHSRVELLLEQCVIAPTQSDKFGVVSMFSDDTGFKNVDG